MTWGCDAQGKKVESSKNCIDQPKVKANAFYIMVTIYIRSLSVK